MIYPLRLALSLLTTLPVGRLKNPTPSDLGRAALAYPLVGLLLGGLVALGALPLQQGPPLLGAALLLLLWVLLTGALHLDGLADTADAWVGSHGARQRALTLLKDPLCGPMGVTALIGLLLVKLAALSALLSDGHSGVIASVPLAARGALLALLLSLPPARPDGMAAAVMAQLPRRSGWWVVAATVATFITLWGTTAIGLTLAIGLALLLYRRWLRGWLHGVTGDTAGAFCELLEAGLLVAWVYR